MKWNFIEYCDKILLCNFNTNDNGVKSRGDNMLKEDLFRGYDGYAWVLEKCGLITKVSNGFADMTGFTYDELKNLNMESVFKYLRVGSNVDINNIDERADYFLFNKSLEVKFVNLRVIHDKKEKVYIFTEKPKSNLEFRYPFLNTLCLDGYYGIGIYSIPDITLIKANEKYISFFDEPYNKKENCIGKQISEILTGFKGSTYEDAWNTVIETGEPYNIGEYMYEGLNRGITYWRLSLIPIHEDNKLKYCVVMITEVTEQVLHRKEIEEQAKIIKEQKEQLEIVIQNVDDAIFIYDSEKKYYLTNKAAKGYLPNSELSKLGDVYDTYKYYDLDGNEIPLDNMTISKVFRGEVVINDKITLRNSRTTKHVSVNGRPIYDSAGNIKFAVLCSRDITQDVEDKNTIEKQNKRLEAIIESVEDVLLVLDKEGNVLKQNSLYSSYCKRLTKNVKDTVNKIKFLDFDNNVLHEEETPNYRVFKKGEKVKDFKVKVIENNKEKYIVGNGIPVLNSRGEVELGIFTTIDITDTQSQNKIINQQKIQLETIMNNVPSLLFVLDSKGNYTYINKIAESYFTKGSLRKHSDITVRAKCLDLSKNIISEHNLPYRNALRNKEVDRRILIIKRDNQENYLQTIAVPLLDDKRNVNMVICIATDITEYIEREQALKKNRLELLQAEIEKNHALVKTIDMKDEFLSFMSHEFRTPLNVINTAIQAINYICGNELPEKCKKYLAMIKQNTFRQLRLVNNLLDITRVDSGRTKINKKNIDIVFLTKAITESVCNYAHNKGITVTFKSSTKKKIIGIDDEKYERILLNLLSNAIKFTPGGKSIIVSLSLIKGSICIKVKDNGIGIPPDKIDLIFEKFGQVDSSLSRQAEGTGIGLSLVKRFVEALSGSISVKSKVGIGTTFAMLFPSEKVVEENSEKEMINLLDNRLIQTTSVEFSDIYL